MEPSSPHLSWGSCFAERDAEAQSAGGGALKRLIVLFAHQRLPDEPVVPEEVPWRIDRRRLRGDDAQAPRALCKRSS